MKKKGVVQNTGPKTISASNNDNRWQYQWIEEWRIMRIM